MALSFSCVFGGPTDEPIHQSDQQVNEDEVMADLLQAFTNDDWEGIGGISEFALPVAPPAPAKPPCCQNDHLQPSPVLTPEEFVAEIGFTFAVTPEITPEETHASISSEEPELIFSSAGSSSPDDQRPDLTCQGLPDAVAQPVSQRPQGCQTDDIHPMHTFQSTQGAQQLAPPQPMHQRQNMVFPAYQGPPFCQVQPMGQNPLMYNIQSMQQTPSMQQAQPVYNTQFMYPRPMYFTQPVYQVQPMYNAPPSKQARPISVNSSNKLTENPPKKRIIEFVEPTVPNGFVANPNNHGRWEIDHAGNKHYLNAPKVKKQRTSK